jgi:hypothetical protein
MCKIPRFLHFPFSTHWSVLRFLLLHQGFCHEESTWQRKLRIHLNLWCPSFHTMAVSWDTTTQWPGALSSSSLFTYMWPSDWKSYESLWAKAVKKWVQFSVLLLFSDRLEAKNSVALGNGSMMNGRNLTHRKEKRCLLSKNAYIRLLCGGKYFQSSRTTEIWRVIYML